MHAMECKQEGGVESVVREPVGYEMLHLYLDMQVAELLRASLAAIERSQLLLEQTRSPRWSRNDANR